VKVKELIEKLSTMDPEVAVAFFSRWAPSEHPLQSAAEVVVHAVTCSVPYKAEGETEERRVKIVALNPSMRALDYLVKEEPVTLDRVSKRHLVSWGKPGRTVVDGPSIYRSKCGRFEIRQQFYSASVSHTLLTVIATGKQIESDTLEEAKCAADAVVDPNWSPKKNWRVTVKVRPRELRQGDVFVYNEGTGLPEVRQVIVRLEPQPDGVKAIMESRVVGAPHTERRVEAFYPDSGQQMFEVHRYEESGPTPAGKGQVGS
jgi:hypothetical protein